ncbi:adenine deaminase [Candidatus Magnetominusculus xianensis]|nr:adenine deaminase [Candidatus Magnetominusculus xianensis]
MAKILSLSETKSMESDFVITGNVVDVINSAIYAAEIEVSKGKITAITKNNRLYSVFIIPGLIDSHVHVESSMLIPSGFARIAVTHGTVATVSDPHEIANVLGAAGIDYMIENGKSVPFKFFFGASSCVPATGFETAGGTIDTAECDAILQRDEIKYLSEMMNYPGVINGDPDIMAKIRAAQKYGKPVDGHAPGLRGAQCEKYVKTGITTDHECLSLDEALEKISYGMKILIREGSAARNFDTLSPLIKDHWHDVMFCSDDIHPDALAKGHINLMVKRALRAGHSIMKVLRCACVNPVLHYGLDAGLLRAGDAADFAVIDGFESFNILKTYIDGQLIAENRASLIPRVPCRIVNKFTAAPKSPGDFFVPNSGGTLNVIGAADGNLITEKLHGRAMISNGNMVSNPDDDILKIAVVNRYERHAPPAIGFIHNFGLRDGAIASSISHDSHNVVAVGVTDDDICEAVNLIIEHGGGICAVTKDIKKILPLPVAGLMTTDDGYEVAQRYAELNQLAATLGSSLSAPFMTLSFMALLVIPHLKLSDRGLFDSDTFQFTSSFAK